MTIPPARATPVGDAAESCKYDDPKTITCTLRAGPEVLQRRRAHVLRREVLLRAQHRHRRPQRRLDPAGHSWPTRTPRPPAAPSAIDTPDDTDGDLPPQQPRHDVPQAALDARPTSIVDEDDLPRRQAARPTTRSSAPARYKLAQYKPGEQAVLEANENYPATGPPRPTRSSSSTSRTRPRCKAGHRERRGRRGVAHPEPDRPDRTCKDNSDADRHRGRRRGDPLLGLPARQARA